MTEDQQVLRRAVIQLQRQYETVPRSRRKGWCLRYTRKAIQSIDPDLLLPHGSTAWESFNALRANPSQWGWIQVHHPLPRYVLAFWGACGYLKDGRMAGHVGILDTQTNVIYSATEAKHSRWWAARLKGAFVPK
jgi:hypothetical protein